MAVVRVLTWKIFSRHPLMGGVRCNYLTEIIWNARAQVHIPDDTVAHFLVPLQVPIAFASLAAILVFDDLPASEMLIASAAAIIAMIVIADGNEPKRGFAVGAPIVSAAWSFYSLAAFSREWQAVAVSLAIAIIVYRVAAWADTHRPPFVDGHPVCPICKTRLHYRSFVPYIAWFHRQCSTCAAKFSDDANCGGDINESKGEQCGEPELPSTVSH